MTDREGRIILDLGHAADDDSYRPEVSLDHEGPRRSELYVIVGEEVGGMIEGVSEASFNAIRERLAKPWGDIRVGLSRHTDDFGLDWSHVVCSDEHGDATFAVFPWSKDNRMAEAYADHLVDLFEVLGLPAERGEPDQP